MKLLILFSLAVAVTAKGLPGTCSVSDWGPWTAWNYPQHDSSAQSYPSGPKTGLGALRRAEMMRIKEEIAAKTHQCKQDGTCPQFASRQVDGPAPCQNGFVSSGGNQYACDAVDQLSRVPTDELQYDPNFDPNGFRETNDIWGWTDPVTGNEIAIVCLNVGTSFVDVSDPENPIVIGHLNTNAGTQGTTWRDVKTIGDYAFIVSEHSGHGMQVFDLNRLRTATPGTQFDADAIYEGVGNTHNIVANEETNFVYMVGSTSGNYPNLCSGGLHAVDVSDPLNPTFAGCFGGDGYVHDAQCVVYNGPDSTYVGREVCFCYNEDTFAIVDVQDKSNMVLVSSVSYQGYAYTHQGWLTEDQTVVLMDDELDEQGSDEVQKTYIWDVRVLANPVLENVYRANFNSIDHNQYILGDLTYQSNYQLGLRILNIDQATYTISEVAYFDAYPDSDEAIFNGAWSTYIYFASGNLVTSSSEYGFFVLRPNMPLIQERIDERKRNSVKQQRTRFREIIGDSDPLSCPVLQETQYL